MGSYRTPSFYKCSVFLWEIMILYYALSKKIKIGFVDSEFTTWYLPGDFELKYVDYTNNWSIDRQEEINYPFTTTYINSVYCRLEEFRRRAKINDTAIFYHRTK